MEVICIKTFNEGYSTFIKNLKYHLVKYDNTDFFYVGLIPTNNIDPYALYPLNNKYRCNFSTVSEQRKLKLEKINEKR